MSNYTIEKFDISRSSNRLVSRVKVKGYWSSDSITAYINREMRWDSNYSATTPEWKVSMSHSSGGRDTKEVADDLEAELNFAEAMTALALYVRDFLSTNLEKLEAAYQAEILEMKQREADRLKEIAERIAADALISKDTVDNLLAALTYRTQIKAYSLGGTRPVYITLANNNNKTYRLNGERVAKRRVLEVLNSASIRTEFVTV